MRRLRLGDRVLRVRDEPEPLPGSGDGAGAPLPLCCVHGAGMSSVVFMDLVRRVSAPGGSRAATRPRRIIAPDLPGHGQSQAWPGCDPGARIDHYRDAVGTVCAHLKVGRAVLVGHSMGAAVALRCALTWPERVAGLVLLNGALRLRVDPEVLALLEAALPSDPSGDLFVDRMPDALAQLSFSPETLPDLRARWQAVLLAASRQVILDDFRACDGFDVRAAAAGLRLPVLVLAGADDLLVPPALSAEAAATIPGAQLVTVPRAGHHALLEQPDLVQDALDAFLLRIS